MNLRSLLHIETKKVPLLPPPRSTGQQRRFRRKSNGDLEECLECLMTPGELDLVQRHRI